MSGELGALLRLFNEEHFATHPVPIHERKILRSLARCGTGELGYADYQCPDCEQIERVPRGCGNRHCPQCQGRLAHAWRERQEESLLDTAYFHAVFTLPHALLPLCAARPAVMYRLLFDAAAETLLQLGRERLGGTLGLTAVLHTWGQQLNRHPHVHVIVTGGALDATGRWHPAKRAGYLFPLGIMGALFRGKFLAGLNALKASGAAPVPIGPKQSTIRAAVAADIAGDGFVDLVVGDAKTGMFIYRGKGQRVFEEPFPIGDKSGAPYSIGVMDLNRDGKLDLVVGRQEARGSVFFNQGSAKKSAFDEASWGDGQGTVYGLALGDLDGDGWPDIVAARSEAPNAIWFSGPVMKK